ncbi:putative bifunctional diguanylate cyclase/phosphodiesterase [Aquifex aeolicus]|uniref:putative bifunctional diguanylate cyclase/phosphodiesterase n=1 Tax=Aquifex aeolicus TaxID=63363 RepID=UPI0023786F5B|nr:bifunctional diguanylate cyclase/phosphodiesterase [Aquifex aeolicus]
MYYLAFFDQLTGLPNRHLFIMLLQRFIHDEETNNLHVCMLNLKNFGEINFLFGFDKGDEILKEIANRLRTLVKEGAAARLSGKAFGIALRNKEREEVVELVEKLSKEKVDSVDLNIKAGISSYPQDGENPKELLEKAELALLFAKNTVNFYKKEYEEKLKKELRIKEFLEESIEKKEFGVVYQPIVSLKDFRPVGAEALVRWYHPELGEVPPSIFVPVAEKYGLVSQINYIVMEKAFRELSDFVKEREFYLSINVNAEQFYSVELIQKLIEFEEKFKFPLRNVILELTERALMAKSEKAVEILSELKKLGVKIAIDDFGTGYSSMHYLVEFDVDEIKIDKSFIDKMLENVNAWQVVRNIIELTHNLNALALAEGVENEEQIRELKKLLCDEAQGYYFSPPLPFKKLIEFVENERQNLIK